jgi:hypothetical protein
VVLTARTGRRRDDAERDSSNRRHENSCFHPRLPRAVDAEPARFRALWPAGTRAMVGASNWYLPMATARTLAHKTTAVKTLARDVPEEGLVEPLRRRAG